MNKQLIQLPGVVGLALVIYALALIPRPHQPNYFLIGAVLMTVTALLNRHLFFIGLQMIVLVGTILGFLILPSKVILALLCSCVVLVILMLIRYQFASSRKDWIGIIGISLLSFSYAFHSDVGFFVSGLAISLFSFMDYQEGTKIALLWLLLNACFAFVAGWQVLS